jgi:hypothetical protein
LEEVLEEDNNNNKDSKDQEDKEPHIHFLLEEGQEVKEDLVE